jgi:hypothetical protein
VIVFGYQRAPFSVGLCYTTDDKKRRAGLTDPDVAWNNKNLLQKDYGREKIACLFASAHTGTSAF